MKKVREPRYWRRGLGDSARCRKANRWLESVVVAARTSVAHLPPIDANLDLATVISKLSSLHPTIPSANYPDLRDVPCAP